MAEEDRFEGAPGDFSAWKTTAGAGAGAACWAWAAAGKGVPAAWNEAISWANPASGSAARRATERRRGFIGTGGVEV
jgi:hypothetical protein